MKTSIVRNWAGNVSFKPKSIETLSNTAEIVALIQRIRHEKGKIRLGGSKHSFSPLVHSSDVFSTLAMTGLVDKIDASPKDGVVNVYAGTKIFEMGPLLKDLNLSMPNQGDVDKQTLAGAFSTGTHGTGNQFGCLANFISEVEFVDGTGKIHIVNNERSQIPLDSVKVNLGTFGVITRYKIKCDPLFIVKETRSKKPIEDCIESFHEWSEQYRHAELFWFPRSRWGQAKLGELSKTSCPRNEFKKYVFDEILEHYAFSSLCNLASRFPAFGPTVSKIAGTLMPSDTFADYGYKVYPSSRNVVFTEMEYALPFECLKECFNALKSMIDREKINVFFPIEIRSAGPDKIWLSPFFERKSVIFSIHTYKQVDHERYFAKAEEIFRSFGGRPHWGKCHSLTRDQILKLYPKWPEFETLRKTFDPDQIFLNDFLTPYFDL
jgi:FAD-linked oxidoreductase